MNWLAASLLVLAALFTAVPKVNAAQVRGKDGFNLPRTGPKTADVGTGTPGGGGSDFSTLLGKPSNLGAGGLEFEDLLKMPFIPQDIANVRGLVTPKNIARGLMGAAVAYTAGEALSLLVKEACVRGMGGSLVMNPDSEFQECIPGKQSDGYTYSYTSLQSGFPEVGRFPSYQSACEAAVAIYKTRSPWSSYSYSNIVGTSGGCRADISGSLNVSGYSIAGGPNRAMSSCPAGWYITDSGGCQQTEPERTYQTASRAAAETKVEDAVKNPVNASKVRDAIKDMFDKGGALEINAPTITGPASGPESSTTTSETVNTSSGPQTMTTTSTVTNNYTYSNSTVTVNQVTTTTTRDAAGNVVSSSTTQTTPESAPTDTPLPELPKLYERKYPNGMVGIWADYEGRLQGSPLGGLVDKLMPQVSDGGACPVWMLNLNVASWAQFGVHDVAPPCWIWDVAKAILILCALLLARALIFGG